MAWLCNLVDYVGSMQKDLGHSPSGAWQGGGQSEGAAHDAYGAAV